MTRARTFVRSPRGALGLLGLAVACASNESEEESTPAASGSPAAAAASAAPVAATSPAPSTAAAPGSPAPGTSLAPSTAPSAAPAPSSRALAAREPDRGPWRPTREAPLTDAPRVYAKSRFVWIWGEPSSEGQWIGYLWTGGSVKLRDEKPVPGPGCNSWYAIEPRGYVCVDGKRATLDPNDAAYRAALPFAARLDSPWPHRYGESRELRLFQTIPKPDFWPLREKDWTAHQARLERARRGDIAALLQGVDLTPATGEPFAIEGLPPSAHEPRDRLRDRSTVAYSAEALAHDRSWLLSADLRWVPKDRVVPYPKVLFQGVHLGGDAQLPLAFFREAERPHYRRSAEGKLAATGEHFERLSWIALTGNSVTQDEETFLETRVPGLYVKQSDASVPTPRPTTPWGAKVGEPDTEDGPRGRRTWIQVGIRGGWLIAYEGTKPVFTTLISPGSGGPPHRGRPLLETASSPVGRFSINGKFATATMVAPHDLVHSDVPWTQNFSGPYALHGAYWHDDWGHPKSGGCINVSPIDGRFLYHWTEPVMPEGWHGMRWLPRLEPATAIILHE